MENTVKKTDLIEACIKAGFCPVCKEKLTTEWNRVHTHKFQFCPINESHHKQLVDYVKDQD